MSLLNKVINESLLQNKLSSELADISYRAVNGKRQKARNFAEGMLNVGTINFNTPKNQITKDMILDYQNEQQKIHYEDATGNKFQYFPSEVTDALNIYTPIPSALVTDATGNPRAATEDDINFAMNDLRKFESDLENSYKKLNNLEQERTEIKKDISKTNKDINLNIDQTKIYETTLRAVTNKLKTINSIKSKPATYKIKEHEQKLLNEESELQNEETGLTTEIAILTSDLATLQGNKLTLEADLKQNKKDIEDIVKIDIPKIEQDIDNIHQIIPQLKTNVEENKIEQLKVKNENKPIIKKYEEAFNLANRNRYSVQQLPHESDEDFLNRLQSLEQLPFDENIFKDKAAAEESKKLMRNLKQILRDDVKISEIVRSFPQPEDIYEINKYFKQISKRLLNLFGQDNKNVKSIDYVNEIKKVIDVINTAPDESYIVEDAPVLAAPAAPAAPAAATALAFADGSPSDFEYNIIDNSLYIKNKSNNKHLYIKIGRKASKNLIFFSNTTNNQGNFSFFAFRGSTPNTWNNIMMNEMQLLTDSNKDIYKKLFGDTLKADNIFDFLKNTYKLTEIQGIKKVVHATSGAYNALTFGWGMKNDEIPKHVKFGKNILLLNKLYYKNILSVKDSNMHAIERFPNTHVSDTLVKIIFDMCKNIQPSKQILDTLTTKEKELLDMLLYLSGLHKNINSNKDDHVSKLKERLKLVEAEIRAGNNNPMIKSELQDLIHKLYLFGAVSLYNANKYLKQF